MDLKKKKRKRERERERERERGGTELWAQEAAMIIADIIFPIM